MSSRWWPRGLLVFSQLGGTWALPQEVPAAEVTAAAVNHHELNEGLHVPDAFPVTFSYVTTESANWKLGPGPNPMFISMEIVASSTTIDAWPETPTGYPLAHVLTVEVTSVLSYWSIGPVDAPRTTDTVYTTHIASLVLWQSGEGREYLKGEPPCEDKVPESNSTPPLPSPGEGVMQMRRERDQDLSSRSDFADIAGAEGLAVAAELESWEASRKCSDAVLNTACNRQCYLAKGLFWCYQHDVEEWMLDKPVVMGRTCWGNGTLYRQLLEPCMTGDYKTGCTAEGGRDKDWVWPYFSFGDNGEILPRESIEKQKASLLEYLDK